MINRSIIFSVALLEIDGKAMGWMLFWFNKRWESSGMDARLVQKRWDGCYFGLIKDGKAVGWMLDWFKKDGMDAILV